MNIILVKGIFIGIMVTIVVEIGVVVLLGWLSPSEKYLNEEWRDFTEEDE